MTADELATIPNQSSLDTPSGTHMADTTTTDVKTNMTMQVDDEEEGTHGGRRATERPKVESVVGKRSINTKPRLVVDREKVNILI